MYTIIWLHSLQYKKEIEFYHQTDLGSRKIQLLEKHIEETMQKTTSSEHSGRRRGEEPVGSNTKNNWGKKPDHRDANPVKRSL